MKLTNAKLRSLSIGKKVSDGGGLYYQPTANNKGKWSYRFAIDGAGEIKDVTLSSFKFQ